MHHAYEALTTAASHLGLSDVARLGLLSTPPPRLWQRPAVMKSMTAKRLQRTTTMNSLNHNQFRVELQAVGREEPFSVSEPFACVASDRC